MGNQRRERERMFAYSIESLIGRLFTDEEFLKMAKDNPEHVSLAYNLSKRETEGLRDFISKMDKINAVELAKGTVAGGYGCSSGGD